MQTTLEILTHPLLSDVRHGFFTRKGGASSGLFAGLNCGRRSTDQRDMVELNRARVATAFACVRCCICADSPLAAAQLLQQSAQQSQRPQVEFKCGKMKKNEGETRVAPDLRKGKLTVRADQDQLMHFIWTNREQGASRVRGVRSVARALPVWAAR